MPDAAVLNYIAALLDYINAQCLAAGALGGLIHAWRVENATAWEVVKYIITGAVAANFIAPQLLKMLALFPIGFIAFGVGMAGKRLCLLLELGFSKIDILGKIKNE